MALWWRDTVGLIGLGWNDITVFHCRSPRHAWVRTHFKTMNFQKSGFSSETLSLCWKMTHRCFDIGFGHFTVSFVITRLMMTCLFLKSSRQSCNLCKIKERRRLIWTLMQTYCSANRIRQPFNNGAFMGAIRVWMVAYHEARPQDLVVLNQHHT